MEILEINEPIKLDDRYVKLRLLEWVNKYANSNKFEYTKYNDEGTYYILRGAKYDYKYWAEILQVDEFYDSLNICRARKRNNLEEDWSLDKDWKSTDISKSLFKWKSEQ